MIHVHNISKRFKSGRSSVQVLSDVSLSVSAGTTLAVAGKSGSGKTTLLNCIGGLERPDHGRIECIGIDIYGLSSRKRSEFQRKNLGFVFQFGNLIPYLNVFENISFPLSLNKLEKENRTRDLLDKIGLQKLIRAMPHELSGGETQRIAFVRAIAHSPKLLLADEPTANLDTETGERLVTTMFDICKEEGCTIILSTHDLRLLGLSDKTLTLLDGKTTGDCHV